MKHYSLANLVMETLDMDALEIALRKAIAESIDYEEIASEIVSNLDIAEIVTENLDDCPF